MRKTTLAAALAAALATCGAVGLTGRAAPVFPDTPTRAHRILGQVAITADFRPDGAAWADLHAPLLADAARARWGRAVDAVIRTRHSSLPDGVGIASSGLAIAWD